MVVCHNKKCIFVHIPKTAGTSIEQFIKENGKNQVIFFGVQNNRALHHYTALELKKSIPQIFNKYYKFAMVRNPYDRLLSEYYWTRIPHLGHKSGKSKDDFLNKVVYIVKNKLFLAHLDNDHFIPQNNFVYDNEHKLLVNEVFKYEKLEETVSYLKTKLNINTNFPFLNRTNSSKKDSWNEQQKNIIYNLYKDDFIIFQYDI